MDNLDTELLSLITRLHKIQAEIGGARPESEALPATDSNGKVDQFFALRNQITETISRVKENVATAKEMENSGVKTRETISLQSQIRSDLSQLNDDWQELDKIYRKEKKKRMSKLSPEELANREEVLVYLQKEIHGVKESQRAGFVKGYESVQLVNYKESELFTKPKDPNVSYDPKAAHARNANITENHRLALKKIKERDHLIDEEIEGIGRVVDELADIARTAHEEVKIQSVMLDVLEEKIEDVRDHTVSVNARLKDTLEKARESDKICMDVVCVLLLVGMIVVLVQLTKKTS